MTGVAVQLLLVGALDAELADQRRTRVIRNIDARLVLLADCAHIAERVHRAAVARVEAREARADLDPRQIGTVHGERRKLLLGELQPYRHHVEAAPRIDRLTQAADLRRGEQPELGKALQRRIEVGRLLADQLELIGRAVERDRLAVAVVDQPSRGRNGIDTDAVALRQLAEVIEAHHLQIEETHRQGDGAERHDQRHCDQAPPEQALLGSLVLQAYRAGHERLRTRVDQRDPRDIVSPAATISGQINAPERIGNQRFHPV